MRRVVLKLCRNYVDKLSQRLILSIRKSPYLCMSEKQVIKMQKLDHFVFEKPPNCFTLTLAAQGM